MYGRSVGASIRGPRESLDGHGPSKRAFPWGAAGRLGARMSSYFIVVLAPQQGGGWRAHFPDFPGCRAEGERIEVAIASATRAVGDRLGQLRQEGQSIPIPRSLEELRADANWAVDRAIDWSKAVVSIVPIAPV